MSKYGITKEEAIVIGLMAATGLVYMFVLIPYLQSQDWFINMTPLYAYWVYNMGWILIFSGTIGVPIGYFVHHDVSIINVVRGGLSSFIFASWIYDLWQPPMYLDLSGKVLIPLGTTSLENTAVDAFWATIWQTFNIGGVFLYIMTYVLVPIITVFVAALILKPKIFLKDLM